MEFGLGVRSLLLVIALVFCTGYLAYADNGLAVFYNPPYYKPLPACPNSLGSGEMIAGVSDKLWNGGAACGKYYKVRCTGPTNLAPHSCRGNNFITVKIVDYCRSICRGDINLSRYAFSQIADPDAGKIKIEYTPA